MEEKKEGKEKNKNYEEMEANWFSVCWYFDDRLFCDSDSSSLGDGR